MKRRSDWIHHRLCSKLDAMETFRRFFPREADKDLRPGQKQKLPPMLSSSRSPISGSLRLFRNKRDGCE